MTQRDIDCLLERPAERDGRTIIAALVKARSRLREDIKRLVAERDEARECLLSAMTGCHAIWVSADMWARWHKAAGLDEQITDDARRTNDE